MGELNGSITTPVAGTWTCEHGVHVVIDFGEFQCESEAIFKTDAEAHAVVDTMMKGLNDFFREIDPVKPEAKFVLETLSTLFAHMTTDQGGTH